MLAVAPLRWVLVHKRRVRSGQRPAWWATFDAAGFCLAADFPEHAVFEVPPERRAGRPDG